MKTPQTFVDALPPEKSVRTRIVDVISVEGDMAYVIPVEGNVGFYVTVGGGVTAGNRVTVQIENGRRSILGSANIGAGTSSIITHGSGSVSGTGIVTWDSIVDKPSTFPPSPHNQDWSTITGKPSLVNTVNSLSGTVVLTTSEIPEGTNLYYTDERAQDAIGTNWINDGHDVLLNYNDTTGKFYVDVDKSDTFEWGALHTFTAGLTANAIITANAGVAIAAGQTLTTPAITATAGLTINPVNNITLNPTGKYTIPYTGYDINLGSISKKYLSLHAAELIVETLVAQDTQATIGGRILVAPTTMLTSDLAPAGTTIYVKHNNLASGDRVRMEAGGQVEFMAVTSAAGGAGPYSYSVTRNLDGTGANQWYAGDALVNTGTIGDGNIDIYSIRSIKSASQYGPAIVGNVRMSATYNDWIEHWAMGNLNGVYGYGDTYGFAAGKYADNSTWISVDSTNGLRINRGATSPVILGQWKMDGEITVGQVYPGKSNVQISAGALKLRNNEDSVITLLSTANAAGQIATFDGVIGVTANGGIWQGSVGTFAAPDTGFKLYQSGSKGVWESWYNGVKQVYIDPADMSLHAPGFVASGSGALLVSRFDGTHPYNTNFSGDAGGHLGQVAAVGGGVIYRPGKYGKALQAAEATTNLISNPSFEVDLTGWSTSGGTRVATGGLYGNAYLSAGAYTYRGVTLPSGQTCTFSFYCKGQYQINVDYGDGVLHGFSGTLAVDGTGWVRFAHTFVATGTAGNIYLYNYSYDAVQLENKAYATPYCDGSLGLAPTDTQAGSYPTCRSADGHAVNGHSWSGTAPTSTSSRAAGTVTCPYIAIPPSGSISVWVNTTALMSANGNFRWIADGGYTNGIVLYITSGDVLGLYVGGSLRCSFTLTDANFPPETWHHVAATWSPTGGCKLYLNGAQVGTTGANASPADDGGGWDIGRAGANYWWPGWIDDFVLLNTVMSATDVKRTYESNVPFYVGTGAWGFRSGNVYANEQGLYVSTLEGKAAFAVASIDGISWGGLTLDKGDVMIGRSPETEFDPKAAYLHWDDSGTTLKYVGRVEADAGFIGGWTINQTSIGSGSISIASDASEGYIKILDGATETLRLSKSGMQMRVDSITAPPHLMWRDSLPSGTLRARLAMSTGFASDGDCLQLDTFGRGDRYAHQQAGLWISDLAMLNIQHFHHETPSLIYSSLYGYKAGTKYPILEASFDGSNLSRNLFVHCPIMTPVGINISPQGELMVRDAATGAGALFWSGNVLNETPVAVIADGTGDVQYRAQVMYVVRDSSGASVSGTASYAVGSDNAITSSTGKTVNIRINANGSVDVRRTDGAATGSWFDVTLWILYQ